MAVRIQCPRCATSYMILSGTETQPNTCPRCRTTFHPSAPATSPAPPPPPLPAPAGPPPPRRTPSAPRPAPPASGPARAPLRQPALGYLMILGAWVIGPGTVVLIGVGQVFTSDGWEGVGAGALVLALGTVTAGWLLVRGRRLVAQHAADALSKDARPPVLLLRSFTDDAMELEQTHSTMFGQTVLTFEEVLADVCSWYGPVIAIGRPGETLPPLGAARLWVDHGSWQHKVTTLLRDCGAVVMIMGAIKGKDGLAWEVETVCNLGLLHKLVLVVPPLKEEATVEARWRSYEALTRGRLPAHQGGEMVAQFDPSGGCGVERSGKAGRDRKTYERLLNASVSRLAGKPRRPLAVTISRLISAVTFGLFVVVLFVGVTIWKSGRDRKKRAQEEEWRRRLYELPPIRPRPREP
jgi:hypothetical protein